MNRYRTKKSYFKYVLFALFIVAVISCSKEEEDLPPIPPFAQGTTSTDPDIITESDKTLFLSLSYLGQDERTIVDHRVGEFVTLSPYLFNSIYEDGLSVEIQVNPEFKDSIEAETLALKFAEMIGRLPYDLRVDLEILTIHYGSEAFRGGNKIIFIYTVHAAELEAKGILEETLIHEGSHVSLDPKYAKSSEWLAAQKADGNFISHYARDFYWREDIAESFVSYVAIRYRSDRIEQYTKDKILETIPNRIKFFDDLNLNMYPIE